VVARDKARGTPLLAIRQALPEGVSVGTPIGTEAPIQGWLSTVYGQKVPGYALEYTRRGTDARFVTLIGAGANAAVDSDVSAQSDKSGLRVHVSDGKRHWLVSIAQQAQPGESVDVQSR